MGRLGWFGMGDVVVDATTWITYGNDILARGVNAGASGPEIGQEALKAVGNIQLFLANRGTELDTVSPGTVNKLDDIVVKLTALGQGNYKPDSVAGAFFDEFGNAIGQEATAGAKAVAAAPGQAYDWVKKQAAAAVDEAVKKGTVPLALIVAGLGVVGFIVYQMKK